MFTLNLLALNVEKETGHKCQVNGVMKNARFRVLPPTLEMCNTIHLSTFLSSAHVPFQDGMNVHYNEETNGLA